MQIKSNSITITLKKREPSKYWTDILVKSKDQKPVKSGVKEEPQDPNASLMNLMKDLYNSGDDNMKRTIAESWSKAHKK